ncbi:alpha/beta hydrolase [Coleofasciculus sp. FACHB-542]|uniref:alpha/beta fold hydrolase n=2 Tax=unclassified Coleofasciculus TaxID=2692782 RepID=UPI001682BBBC|nr:alpha/beta hydrolase [Coleofasciculus sp. FACHB-542]MBD2084120.1 alpha/beta hydrolase [Coleofasciculus sp. FACHB-542]
MFADFLPSQVQQLRESASIALAQKIERQAIKTPLSPQPIATAYVHQGNGGTPILLLPGFDSSVLEFRCLLPLLAAQNETWTVDLLGFGFTDRVQGILYNPDAIKTHLYYFWKTYIQVPVMLVGASMGGAAAIDFTLTYPHAVKKLVLIDSVGFSGSFPLASYLFPPLDFLAVEYWRQRKLQALLWGSTFGNLEPTAIEAIRCAALHMEMPGWHEAIIAFMKSGGYWNLADRIPQIDKRTLILWGEADDMLGTDDAERFKRAIAHSQLIWIENCGHVPQFEQPEITAKHILAFR